MLDQRTSGNWAYKDLIFNFKPFYVGIGTKYRMTAHFLPSNLRKKSIKNNIIKSIFLKLNEYPIYYQIYKNLTKNDAIRIETDIIKHFGKIKDKTGILSNLTDGGDGICGFSHNEKYKNTLKKKLYQYDLNGQFIKEWESLKSVVDYYNLSGGAGIRASINKNFHCHGFLWSYHKFELLNKHRNKNIPKYRYSIFDDNNKLIKTFIDYSDIEFYFNRKISKGNISMCCNGKLKTYLGYKWKKEIS